MKLTLAEPAYLKESIYLISDLVNEVRFKITSTSIDLIAMDVANVAMVIFNLSKNCFTEYDVKEDTEISINLINLKQILKRSSPKDIITLEMDKGKLKIELKSSTTRTFSLPLIDIEEKKQKIPDLKYSVSVKTSSKSFYESINDAEVASESVTFIAEPKKFTMDAQGDLNQANIEISADDKTTITMEGDKVQAKYSIEYLKKMIAGSKISDQVEIHFNKDYPLRLDYSVTDKMTLSFVLAPRIEND